MALLPTRRTPTPPSHRNIAGKIKDLPPGATMARLPDQGPSHMGKPSTKPTKGQGLSIEQLATISDQALNAVYGYGTSQPGGSFGWQANLKSAAYAKRLIDRGVTNIETISAAVHRGWNRTAREFVNDPNKFSDTPKARAEGTLEEKINRRRQLSKIPYDKLSDNEKEKDRVVARALLMAIKNNQEPSDPHVRTVDQISRELEQLDHRIAVLTKRQETMARGPKTLDLTAHLNALQRLRVSKTLEMAQVQTLNDPRKPMTAQLDLLYQELDRAQAIMKDPSYTQDAQNMMAQAARELQVKIADWEQTHQAAGPVNIVNRDEPPLSENFAQIRNELNERWSAFKRQ